MIYYFFINPLTLSNKILSSSSFNPFTSKSTSIKAFTKLLIIIFFGILSLLLDFAFKPKLCKNSVSSKDNDTDVFIEGSLVKRGCSSSIN